MKRTPIKSVRSKPRPGRLKGDALAEHHIVTEHAYGPSGKKPVPEKEK